MRRALVLLLLLGSALAGAANYTTERFITDYVIRKDRLVEVTERIELTYTAPSHGIVRSVPFRYKGNSGRLRQVRIDLVGVEADYGRGFSEEPAKAEEVGGDWKLRIGDPDVTHSGPAVYRLRYTLRGALTDIENGDAMGPRTELNWHVIPTGWATSIGHAEGTISFPPPTEGDTAARMLIGSVGSRRGVEVHLDGRVVGGNPVLKAEFQGNTRVRYWTTRSLDKGIAIAAIVGLPQGTVDRPATNPEVPVTDAAGNPYSGMTDGIALPKVPDNSPLAALIPLVVLPLTYLWARPRFAPKTGPLTVRFEPPTGIGASECGLLIDGNVDSRDVIAGIIALAQKGALRLRHESGDAASVTIEVLPFGNSRNTTIFEQRLYASLEPYGPVITPEILRGNFYPAYQALEADLYRDSLQKGWFRSHGNAGCTPGCLVSIALFCGAGMLIPIWGTGAMLASVVTIVGVWILLSRTSNLLPLGAKLKAECLGLKEFITRANQRELNYMANRMPDQAMFEELLPYAVAFNAVQQWTQAFAGINLQPPDWYYGYDAYGTDYLWTAMLVNDLMYFDNSYSQAVSSPPVTSYGTGGGFGDGDSGFGGGFSGGDSGGSSWDSGGSFDSGGSIGDSGGGGGGDSW